MAELVKTPVAAGRVKGLFYASGKADKTKPILVLFNQWRSGAHFIISKYMAEMTLGKGVYGGVLFLDRIASSGESDEHLTVEERKNMKSDGDFQFGKVYADALIQIMDNLGLPQKYVIGGSSAGAPAALACVDGMDKSARKAVRAIILVESGGLKKNGFGKKGHGAIPAALGKHVLAYRHRIQRGWWTPMDKEQYFSRKGRMFEHRAKWWAGDFIFQELLQVLGDMDFPPTYVILSKTSHVHTIKERGALKNATKPPHRYIEITGNHDKICQPPRLSELYSDTIR